MLGVLTAEGRTDMDGRWAECMPFGTAGGGRPSYCCCCTAGAELGYGRLPCRLLLTLEVGVQPYVEMLVRGVISSVTMVLAGVNRRVLAVSLSLVELSCPLPAYSSTLDSELKVCSSGRSSTLTSSMIVSTGKPASRTVVSDRRAVVLEEDGGETPIVTRRGSSGDEVAIAQVWHCGTVARIFVQDDRSQLRSSNIKQ